MSAGWRCETYDVASFTFGALGCVAGARMTTRLFDRAQWLEEGDRRSVERIARELAGRADAGAVCDGIIAAVPAGGRHRGNSSRLQGGMAMEKWHGFDELARRFSSVVIVGSEEDLRTDNTYFRRAFEWPVHAQNLWVSSALPTRRRCCASARR